MATITALKQQVGRQDRYSLFLDGKYAFSLSEQQLAVSGLRIGSEVSTADLDKWKDTSLRGKALDRVYGYLSFRDRSVHEVRDYLRRKEYDAGLIDAVVDELTANKILDDERFTRAWVADRQEVQGHGRRRLQQELRQKGIDRELADRVLSELDEEDELQVLVQLIEARQLRRRYPDDQKLMAYLARRGYSYGLIKQALVADSESAEAL